MDSFEINVVGLSQKWDSFEAGVELAKDLVNQSHIDEFDLVLVFSTIQYRTNGGFQKLLDGFYSIIKGSTKLVGGTVAGFTIPQGCFTHGVAAFALKSNKIDFAVAENIKRNPEKSAGQCAIKIDSILKTSKFKNKFILSLPSGTTTPYIPGVSENSRVIRSKVLSKLLIYSLKLSLLFFQKGPGREETIIETLASKLPDYDMIGGSFIDDNKGYFNYQFYNNKVYTNMLFVVGLSTDYKLSVNSNFGLVKRGENFKITKTSVYGLVIEKINGKDAFGEILNVLKWPEYFLNDSARILKRTFYAPIGYEVDGKQYTSMIAFIYGMGVVVSPKVRSETAFIMMNSGKSIIDVVDQNINDTKGKKIKFGLISSCIVRLETLGSSTYKVHEKLLEHFGSAPFIQIDVVGEDIYTKKYGAKRIADSFNTAIFYEGD